MLIPLQERPGIAVRSVKRMCPWRNLSVLNPCNMCSQRRHLLNAVLLTPISLSCLQCDDSEERGSCVCISFQAHSEHPLNVFLWWSHLSLVSPSLPASVLYYRSSYTLQGKVGKHYHPTCCSVTEQFPAASISGLLEQEDKHCKSSTTLQYI